jgi:arabinogalactan endo-1,4-beta-galactosidase
MPDIVQIGNEITPGMLLHVCDGDGQPTGSNAITGAISNWANLGALLKAGVKGVKAVDTRIQIMLHIDRGGDKGGYTGAAASTSSSFIDNAQKQGVVFDVFGESCYQAYQGDPTSSEKTQDGWSKTFGALAIKYPKLRFVAAEYGPMQRQINDVVFALPGAQGAGTFNWEPTQQGDWNTGHALFTASGNNFSATADGAWGVDCVRNTPLWSVLPTQRCRGNAPLTTCVSSFVQTTLILEASTIRWRIKKGDP